MEKYPTHFMQGGAGRDSISILLIISFETAGATRVKNRKSAAEGVAG